MNIDWGANCSSRDEVYPGAQFQTDEQIAAITRNSSSTLYHVSASNRMGPVNDSMTVVDTEGKFMRTAGNVACILLIRASSCCGRKESTCGRRLDFPLRDQHPASGDGVCSCGEDCRLNPQVLNPRVMYLLKKRTLFHCLDV